MVSIKLLSILTAVIQTVFSQQFITTMMSPGVYGVSNMLTGDHSMFIVTSEGVVAIEPFSTTHATGLLGSIRNTTDAQIKMLLVTHNHWDHASGTKVFSNINADIICHEEALNAIRANLGPDQEVPNKTWKGKKQIYNWGNLTFEFHYLGMNHGNGMTVVLVPGHKVAYIADIVSPERLLFSVSPDFNMRELNRTLYELKDMDFNKSVYAHNTRQNPSSIYGGTKQDVLDLIQFLTDLRAETLRLLFNGSIPFMNVAKSVRLPKYQNWGFYNDFLVMNAWRIITDVVMGPYPWKPPYKESQDSGASISNIDMLALVFSIALAIFFQLSK